MATYNNANAATATSTNLLNSAAVTAVAEHFDRTSATFILPSSSTTPLNLDTFVSAGPHFVNSTTSHHHLHQQQQQQQQQSTSSSYTFLQIKREPCQVSEVTTSNNFHQQPVNSTPSIHNQQLQHHHHNQSGGLASTSVSKTMSTSSTLTTLVKIEAASPKVTEMEKVTGAPSSTNNSVPIGIAVARKRPQETSLASLNSSSSSLPVQQSNLNKDLNCFGIRVADLGGVSTGCGNIYFTGNGDLMTGPSAAEELALTAAGMQSVNRAPSTFWQYPNALPIESVISMSPATVGLQYSREANRGQVVLLPAPAAALGISNFPLYCTPTDPFQQAAAAFVWPSYLPQGNTSSSLQPPPNFIFPSMSPHSTLQPQSYATSLQLFGSNYLTAAAAAAAAAAATSTLCQHSQQQQHQSSNNGSINLSLGAATSGSITANSCTTSSSRFLSVASAAAAAAAASTSAAVTSTAASSATFVDTTTTTTQRHHNSNKHQLNTTSLPLGALTAHSHLPLPPPLPLPLPLSLSLPPPPGSLLLPPTSMKIEEWTGATTTTLSAHHMATPTLQPPPQLPPPPPSAPLHYELRGDSKPTVSSGSVTGTTSTTATHLLDYHGNNATQALNLMRLPTPPTSANVENAAMAAVAAATGTPHLPTQLLFQNAASPVPTLLNLSASLPRSLAPVQNFLNTTTTTSTLSAPIGPPTPMSDDTTTISCGSASDMALNYKTNNNNNNTSGNNNNNNNNHNNNNDNNNNNCNTIVETNNNNGALILGAMPQMQDVNIQTDTPVCSEDENSSCAMNGTVETQAYSSQDTETQQPLELTKHNHHLQQQQEHHQEQAQQQLSESLQNEECHNNNDDNDNNNNNNNAREDSTMAEEEPTIDSNSTPTQHVPLAPVASLPVPADLTGLELLSNISTSKLAKTEIPAMSIRVKQEPMDHMDTICHNVSPNCLEYNTINHGNMTTANELASMPSEYIIPQSRVSNEPLGALDLLCALAEQRIQEEVQCGGPTSVFATPSTQTFINNNNNNNKYENDAEAAELIKVQSNGYNEPLMSTSVSRGEDDIGNGEKKEETEEENKREQLAVGNEEEGEDTEYNVLRKSSLSSLNIQNQNYLNLMQFNKNNNNNNNNSNDEGMADIDDNVIIKRKKHKHSKKLLAAANGNLTAISKKLLKSERKKNKKKKKKKHATLTNDMEYEEQQSLQEELKCTLSSMAMETNFKQSGKWPPANPQELFNIMETGMRLRLADITRQYRKKKRKLDEISKTKKNKKKGAKHALQLQQQQEQQQQLVISTTTTPTSDALVPPSLTLGATTGTLSLVAGDYKFPKFSTGVPNIPSNGSTSSNSPYLNTTSFIRFSTEKSQSSPLHVQFPPPEVRQAEESSLSATSPSSSNITMSSYKPVRLEPSALAAAENNRNCNAALRLSKKHAALDKSLQAVACKERKLLNSSNINNITLNNNSNNNNNLITSSSLTPSRLQSPAVTDEVSAMEVVHPQNQQHRNGSAVVDGGGNNLKFSQQTNSVNRELTLTSEHLFRNETRVLTDMGGLFYAGVLKPLQPPDVYAITLDGERGNKSHIMSREEVLKDTIIEMAPKSVESIPVGTRLCAYWSQQYRCLYPGRAIESESSDEEISTPRDFVSVEFDDGDSGRIRLQNIRLLLSDYPIAEYNDNPLYSLGKHKKSTVKSQHASLNEAALQASSSAASHAVNGNSTIHKNPLHHQTLAISTLYLKSQQQQHHQHQQSLLNINKNASSASPSHNATAASDEQRLGLSIKSSSKELLTKEQRTEKKRLKSLKKKAAAAAAASVVTHDSNGLCGTTNNILMVSPSTVTSIDGDDVIRKHRKHKKRKKHKKHNHRKNNNNNNNINSINGKKCDLSSNLRVSKQALNMQVDEEQDEQLQSNVEEDDDDDANENPNNNSNDNSYVYGTSTSIKIESNNQPNQMIKVKSENLFVDEETTSNLMSEMSDEMKCDDVIEHNNNKGSKIAAFLPDRQLWGWQGKAYRKAGMKGRARKQFYKTIKRGKETITVGESAVFLSTGRPDRPYIGRIESMWETTSSNKVVRVRWFYHPEETSGSPNLKYPGALFESPHEDENDVQTISHRCEVLPFTRYFTKFGADSKQYQSIYDNNDTYYLAGYYNPRLQVLKLQDDIPIIQEDKHSSTYNINNNNTNSSSNNHHNSIKTTASVKTATIAKINTTTATATTTTATTTTTTYNKTCNITNI